MVVFSEELQQIRKASRYPDMKDFARYSGLHPEMYRDYEKGTRVPSKVTLEKIISGACLTKEEAKHLREVLNAERAHRAGIDLRPPGAIELDIPKVSERIVREIEYELKRAGITISNRKRDVCILRAEMILKDALGES